MYEEELRRQKRRPHRTKMIWIHCPLNLNWNHTIQSLGWPAVTVPFWMDTFLSQGNQGEGIRDINDSTLEFSGWERLSFLDASALATDFTKSQIPIGPHCASAPCNDEHLCGGTNLAGHGWKQTLQRPAFLPFSFFPLGFCFVFVFHTNRKVAWPTLFFFPSFTLVTNLFAF